MEVDDGLTPKLLWGMADGQGSGAAAGRGWVPRVGVVVAVDRDKGEITLVRPGETPSCLTAEASLLKDVRPWGVVQMVTDGTVIRGPRTPDANRGVRSACQVWDTHERTDRCARGFVALDAGGSAHLARGCASVWPYPRALCFVLQVAQPGRGHAKERKEVQVEGFSRGGG